MVMLGRIAQAVEDDAGLHRGQLGAGIDGIETVHVAGEIEDHGDIGALPRKTGASAAGQHRRPRGATRLQCGFDIGRVPRIDDTDGELSIIRRVRRVECARTKIEQNIAAQRGLELGFQIAMRGEVFVLKGGEVVED